MRRAILHTTHGHPEVVARAIRPDNTTEMDTRVEGDAVVTTFERDTTGGLRSTLDDYVVNLQVATQLTDAQTDEHATDADTASDTDADTETATDTDTNHE